MSFCCRIRECVKEFIEDGCDSDELIPLYIDAVNIYRRDSVKLLNKQCIGSSAPDIGISIATVMVAFFIVFVVWLFCTEVSGISRFSSYKEVKGWWNETKSTIYEKVEIGSSVIGSRFCRPMCKLHVLF